MVMAPLGFRLFLFNVFSKHFRMNANERVSSSSPGGNFYRVSDSKNNIASKWKSLCSDNFFLYIRVSFASSTGKYEKKMAFFILK